MVDIGVYFEDRSERINRLESESEGSRMTTRFEGINHNEI